MTPGELLVTLTQAGFALTLGTGEHAGRLLVEPGGRLSPEQRALIVEHKPALLALLSGPSDAVVDAMCHRAFVDSPFADPPGPTTFSPSVVLTWEAMPPMVISRHTLDRWQESADAAKRTREAAAPQPAKKRGKAS